jgi:hypothetical protein
VQCHLGGYARQCLHKEVGCSHAGLDRAKGMLNRLASPPHGLRTLVQDGILLTEAQIAALEKAKADKEAHGEFESECPGYCGAQDTFYVGTLKGVGRIYQQTFIDTYTKVAFAKLYDRNRPLRPVVGSADAIEQVCHAGAGSRPAAPNDWLISVFASH